MYLFSSLYQGPQIELLISDLRENGFSAEDVLALPLNPYQTEQSVWKLASGDKLSGVDYAAILATVFMLLGCIYGYVLPIGPILSGFIGLLAGGGFGFLLGKLIRKKKPQAADKSEMMQVLLIVACTDQSIHRAEAILKQYQPIGAATLKQ